MKKIGFLIFGFCLLLSLSAKAELFGLKEYTLNNGLKLIVVPNHKVPIAKHMVLYKVGASDEKAGKGGSAHLLEHLMFRGTKEIKGDDFNKIMEENGASSNAYTSQNFTAYHQFVDISRLELAMFLESDRMQNLKISDEAFEKEQKIVYQERKQVVENNPLYKFNEAVQRAFWQDHPYSRPITGTEEEILSLTKKDVYDIYNHFYSPDNAILIIAGDIKPEKALELAEKYYGQIPAKNITNNRQPEVLDTKNIINIRMQLPKIEISRWLRKYKAPNYLSDKKVIYAYMILSKYLGEDETSYLHNKLVVDDNVATAVSTSYDATSYGNGSFTFSFIPTAENKVDNVKEYFAEAVSVAIKKFNENELKNTKNKILAGLVYAKDNPADAVGVVANMVGSGMSVEEVDSFAENIKDVKLEEVKKAAADLLKSSYVEAVAEPFATKGEKK